LECGDKQSPEGERGTAFLNTLLKLNCETELGVDQNNWNRVRKQHMTKQMIIITACLLFVAAFFVGFWPKACLDKFHSMLAKSTKDPKSGLTFQTMRSLDVRLYRQYLTGLILSSAFTLGFLVLMLWAMIFH
jgi:hypothetical protein